MRERGEPVETRVQTDVGLLVVRRVGPEEGRPVVLWPGLFFDGAQLAPLARELAREGFRVAVVEPPGMGGSTLLTGHVRMEDCGRALLAVCEALGLPRAVLGGTSWGGICAVHAALQAPGRVEALVLMNTPFAGGGSAGFMGLIPRLAGTLPSGFMAWGAAPSLLGRTTLRTRPGLKQVLAAGLRGSTRRSLRLAAESVLWTRPDLRPLLPRVVCPALVLAGSEDAMYPLSQSEQAAALLPAGRLEVVEGTGHSSALEAPEHVRARVTSFLQGLAEPDARVAASVSR
jgi:3-oxoadipate enol-lactonase